MRPAIPVLFSAMGAILFFGGCNPTTPPGPSGLTERPQNNECVAFARETAGSAQTIALAFNLGDTVTGLFQAPGDNTRWYATTKSGVLAAFANTDTVSSYKAISGVPTVNANGEGGLLSMAFHPMFAINRQVFLSYTASNATGMVSRISRYTLGTDDRLSNGTVFLELQQPASNHNGGSIAFGPDGYLYIGFGDGGGADDQFGNGQNLATLHSKMLRIDIDRADTAAGTLYSIPAGNMSSAATGFRKEIYAHGFRNPWKWSFDNATGEMWVADVGQNKWEEVNRVDVGRNYGWPITEGNHCFRTATCNTAFLSAPVFEYDHTAGCSITGGFVYRGSAIPALYGQYLYGDYCAQGVHSFATDSPMQTDQLLTPQPGGITTFGEANNGEILIGAADGSLYRLAPSTNVPAPELPTTLSQHPCYANAATQQLSPGVIPYSVNSALWSDGAAKTRFVALPDDQKITLDFKGDMIFPVGSVLIKQFYHNQRIVETRFLMNHSTGWAGYSYEWNSAGTDATLSTTAHTKVIDSNYTHIFPSQTQCFQCHTKTANLSLGLETAQLNRLHHYASTNLDANQLDTWQHIGLFTTAINASNRKRYVPPVDDISATAAARARGYLHSNCSGCHRPGGFPAHIDLRYDTVLPLTGLCNIDPSSGDLGISGAKLLVPGNADLSLLYQRMARVDEHRMPPLASGKVDATALTVVRSWINGLTGCN